VLRCVKRGLGGGDRGPRRHGISRKKCRAPPQVPLITRQPQLSLLSSDAQ